MRFTTAVFALAAFASTALAHMEMIDPAPFRSKANKLIDQSTVDFNMNSPLSSDGSNFPCKGYHTDLNLKPAGDTDTTWSAGSPQKVTLDDSAAHNGGSCQLSLSYDGGKTFRVIKSIEGNCVKPGGGEHSFDFTVPADAKSGKVIFAWTWFNHTGNREMYMNCAAVTITGTGTSTLEDRPEIFKANIDNGCTTEEGTDVKFPDPGPDVEVLSNENLRSPPKSCQNQSSDESANPDPTEPAESADPTDSPAADDTGSTSSADPTEPAADDTSSTSSASSADPTNSPAADDTTSTSSTRSASSADPIYAAPTDSDEPTKDLPTSTSSTSAPTTAPTDGSSTTYTVKAGDICNNIANQQGVELANLYKLNPSINQACTNLQIGQVLNLRVRSRIMRDLY